MKIISNKKNQVTIEKDWKILKIVDYSLFKKLLDIKEIKANLNVISFSSFKNKWDYYILFYKKYEISDFINNFINKNTWFNEFKLFNDYIIKDLIKLNSWFLELEKGLHKWFIHEDPQAWNIVYKNWENFFIDLEALSFSIILLQPLYLFRVVFMDVSYNKEDYFLLFEDIFLKFINLSNIYLDDLKNIDLNYLLNYFIEELESKDSTSLDKKLIIFIKLNFTYLKNILKKFL